MSAPQIPVSWGELLDKITILAIKRERIMDEPARANVAKELALLTEKAAPVLGQSEVIRLMDELKSINQALWDIEDRIREKEAAKAFDQDFVELARSILPEKRPARRAQAANQSGAGFRVDRGKKLQKLTKGSHFALTGR